MLNQGIYLAPSAFEAGFVSIAHDDEAIEKQLQQLKLFLDVYLKTEPRHSFWIFYDTHNFNRNLSHRRSLL